MSSVAELKKQKRNKSCLGAWRGQTLNHNYHWQATAVDKKQQWRLTACHGDCACAKRWKPLSAVSPRTRKLELIGRKDRSAHVCWNVLNTRRDNGKNPGIDNSSNADIVNTLLSPFHFPSADAPSVAFTRMRCEEICCRPFVFSDQTCFPLLMYSC